MELTFEKELSFEDLEKLSFEAEQSLENLEKLPFENFKKKENNRAIRESLQTKCRKCGKDFVKPFKNKDTVEDGSGIYCPKCFQAFNRYLMRSDWRAREVEGIGWDDRC